MFFRFLFSASIIQGLFLIVGIARRAYQNKPASLFIITILVIMLVNAYADLVLHSDLRYYTPQAFILPFGMMFLLGPIILFLYTLFVGFEV